MNSSKKIIPIYMCVAGVVAAVVRFFQYTTIIDPNSGFFVNGAGIGAYLVYVLLVLFAVCFFVLAVVDKKQGSAAYTLSSDGMGDHATQVFGIGHILGALLYGVNIISGNVDSLALITNAVVGIGLLITGLILLKNTKPPEFTGHILEVCAAAAFLRGAGFFGEDLLCAVRSDRLIALLSYIFFAAFLASYARFFARLETEKSRMRVILTGGFTFLICAVHVIAKLLAHLSSSSAEFTAMNYDIAGNFVVIGVFIFVLYCTVKTKDLVVLEDEDEYYERKKKEKESNS